MFTQEDLEFCAIGLNDYIIDNRKGITSLVYGSEKEIRELYIACFPSILIIKAYDHGTLRNFHYQENSQFERELPRIVRDLKFEIKKHQGRKLEE